MLDGGTIGMNIKRSLLVHTIRKSTCQNMIVKDVSWYSGIFHGRQQLQGNLVGMLILQLFLTQKLLGNFYSGIEAHRGLL